MISNVVPNWLRVILSVLSLYSFLPQLRDIIAKKDSTGISFIYALLNLIAATEQFAMGFWHVVGHSRDSEFFVSDPRNIGDWLNLAQLLIVWIMNFILFFACLLYSKGGRGRYKAGVIAIYTCFLLLSVVPIFFDATITEEGPYRGWFSSILISAHEMFICLPVTLGGIFALFSQWRNAKALNTFGLATQAVVFAFVAFSWIFRVRFGIPLERGPQNIHEFWAIVVFWYQVVGWAAVDNAIFAIVQLILLCLSKHQRGGEVLASTIRPAEEEPLLAS